MPTHVQIVPHHGRTAIAVDGAVIPGMSYFTYAHLHGRLPQREFQEMVDAGMKIFFCPWLINVRVLSGRDEQTVTWREDGSLDCSLLDEWMGALSALAGDLWFLPRLYLSTPYWWAERYPEELVRYADHDVMQAAPARGFRYHAQASMASSRWREDIAGMLRKLVAHVENGPFGDRVLGYMLNSGGTEEWVYWGAQQGKMPDYSAPAQAAFRRWLQERYGSDAALAEAWGSAGLTCDAASIPTLEARRRCDPYLIRDPRIDRAAIDYDLFLSDLCAETLLGCCAAVKAATDRRRLTGAFYGYLLWQTGLINPALNNAHLALRKLLDSPDLDFVTGITSYNNREPGGPGSFMLPIESLQAAGKLHYSEVDVRTHLVSTPRSEKYEAGPEATFGIWPLKNAGQSVAVYRREFAHQLIHGSAWWDFDMEGGWYSCPEMLEELAHHSRIARRALEWDMSSIAEVAGVVSGVSPAYHRFAREHDAMSAEWDRLRCDLATANLYKAGAPLDWWMTDDLGREELRRYKVLYFHNAEYLTPRERAWVEQLKSDGRTLIFLSLAGAVTDAGVDAAQASALTGIRVRLREDRQPLLIDVTVYDDALTLGCQSQATLGTSAIAGPRLEVTDPDARILGVWRSTGQPAIAVKEFSDWRAIYCAAPLNHAAVFRAIARTAGCHIWTETDRIIFANRSLLAVHSSASSELAPLSFPAPVTLTDLFTGEVAARHAVRFTAPDTRLDGTQLYRMEF